MQMPQRTGSPGVVVVATHTGSSGGPVPLPFVREPDSTMAASFRVLRHRLRKSGDPRVIAVTSPVAREGKTTCAIALAMSLAEHGREKVMLLEANLRRPRVGEALGFSPPACFGHQMATHLENPDVPWKAVAAFFDNLHVLAVAPSTAGTMMLSPPAFQLAMSQIRSAGYGYVVVDCPAALGSADVNLIEDAADGVLLSALAGTTTKKSLRRARAHLEPAPILGIVLMNK